MPHVPRIFIRDDVRNPTREAGESDDRRRRPSTEGRVCRMPGGVRVGGGDACGEVSAGARDLHATSLRRPGGEKAIRDIHTPTSTFPF